MEATVATAEMAASEAMGLAKAVEEEAEKAKEEAEAA